MSATHSCQTFKPAVGFAAKLTFAPAEESYFLACGVSLAGGGPSSSRHVMGA